MTETENSNFSFDGLPHTVAELHAKIDRLMEMLERFVPPPCRHQTPSGDNDGGGCIRHALQSRFHYLRHDFRTPYSIPQAGQQALLHTRGNKIVAMDSVVPKDAPKRTRKPDAQKGSHEPDGLESETGTGQPDEEDGIPANEPPTGNDTGTERQNPPYTIEQRTHTRNGANIFAVLFPNEIEAAGERKFVQTAREFHGYWSDFGNGGYIFNTRQEAEDFARAIIGKEENKRTTEEGLARSYSPL